MSNQLISIIALSLLFFHAHPAQQKNKTSLSPLQQHVKNCYTIRHQNFERFKTEFEKDYGSTFLKDFTALLKKNSLEQPFINSLSLCTTSQKRNQAARLITQRLLSKAHKVYNEAIFHQRLTLIHHPNQKNNQKIPEFIKLQKFLSLLKDKKRKKGTTL